MNIIVTTSNVVYKKFIKLSTLSEAKNIVGVIDYLIYNKSEETVDDKISSLTSLKDRAKNIIYVRNEDDTDLAVKMFIVGIDGKYVDDEYFLNSDEDLCGLITSIDDVKELVELGGVNILSDFLNRYFTDGSASFNKNYLSVVKNAVSNLIDDYSQKSHELVRMSETASEIFSSTSAVVSNMRKEHEELKIVVESLEKSINTGKAGVLSQNRRESPVSFFPTISYLKEKRIVRIKEFGSVSFLLSFMMGYRVYLERIKNLRPKLIIVEPKGDILEEKYSQYKWVTFKGKRDRRNYYSNVVFTNNPDKEVMINLLDDNDYDTFVVVDRMLNSKEHILNSKGNMYYAVNGNSCIVKFNLKAKKYFSSISVIGGSLFTIPVFPEYPSDVASRERFYTRECAGIYDKLV